MIQNFKRRPHSPPAGEVVLSRVSNQAMPQCRDHNSPAEPRQETTQSTVSRKGGRSISRISSLTLHFLTSLLQFQQPADATTAAVIKVEDDDCVSWSQSEPDSKYKNLKRAFFSLFDSV